MITHRTERGQATKGIRWKLLEAGARLKIKEMIQRIIAGKSFRQSELGSVSP